MTQATASQRTDTWARLGSLAASALVALMFVQFAVLNIRAWQDTGTPTLMIFAVQEAILVFLYIVRRPAAELNRNPLNWFFAVVGTLAPLFLTPYGSSVAPISGMVLQATGALLAVYATIALGRSFGIVPANRGIKDTGPYGLVRHPVYAAYLIAHVGVLLGAASWRNIVALAICWGAQVWRMRAEEATLSLDPQYRDYMTRVRNRLIPAVY